MAIREDLIRVGRAALLGAEAEFKGKEYAIVIVVRPLQAPGQQITSNITSGSYQIATVLTEAATQAVKGQT